MHAAYYYNSGSLSYDLGQRQRVLFGGGQFEQPRDCRRVQRARCEVAARGRSDLSEDVDAERPEQRHRARAQSLRGSQRVLSAVQVQLYAQLPTSVIVPPRGPRAARPLPIPRPPAKESTRHHRDGRVTTAATQISTTHPVAKSDAMPAGRWHDSFVAPCERSAR
jgi:hypothetical protein